MQESGLNEITLMCSLIWGQCPVFLHLESSQSVLPRAGAVAHDLMTSFVC